MPDIFDQIAEEDIFDQVARETPAPILPVIAGTEGMELFSDNSAKINQKYKNSVSQSRLLKAPLSTTWSAEETFTKQLGNRKLPESKIPEVNLPYPRVVGPNDDVGQIANDLGLPVGEPSVLGKTLAIPFIPVHELLWAPGAVSEVELASIPEELEIKGSSILDLVEIGAQQLADKVFPGGYTAEDAGEALDLNPEFAGQIARVAVDLAVGYLYAGAVIKTIGGVSGELINSTWWRSLAIKDRRLVIQTVEGMQEAGLSEAQILKSLNKQGRTAEFNEFKTAAIQRRRVNSPEVTDVEIPEAKVAEVPKVPEGEVAPSPEIPGGEVANPFKDSAVQEPVFHGTADIIEEFNLEELGRTTGAPSAQKGIFFTSSRELADFYSTYALPKQADKLFDEVKRIEEKLEEAIDDEVGEILIEKVRSQYNAAMSKYEDEMMFNAPEANIVDSHIDLKNPLIHDFEGLDRGESYSDLIDRAIENKNDGLILKNTYDGLGERGTKTNPLTDIYIVFSPDQIKIIKPEIPAGDVAKVEPIRPEKPTIPEVRFEPVPKEPIPVEEIDTVQKLSSEASRRALENIKAQDLKEEKKILTQARKEAGVLVKESQLLFQALDDIDKAGGLNRASVEAAGISPAEIANINKKRPGLIQKKGDLKADVFAESKGFDSVDDMLERIRTTPGIKEQAGELSQQIFDDVMIGIDEGRALDLRERILDEEINVLKSMLGRKPKARKDLKGVIRRETGQVKVKDVLEVDTAAALKDQLTLEARAAREAFRAGKIESALKHKEKQRDITARLRERKQQSTFIKKVSKDFKGLLKKTKQKKRQLGQNIPEPQRTNILNMLEGVDFAKPTKKTLKGLLDTKAFLEASPEQTMLPDRVLKELDRLSKTPLRDMTMDDVESMHQAIMHQAKLAEMKTTIKVKRKRQNEVEVVDGAIKDLRLPQTVSTDLQEIVDATEIKKRSIGRMLKDNFIGIRQEGFDLIIESIAGRESVIYDVLFKQPNAGTRKVLESSQGFYDNFNADLKRFGFEPVATKDIKVFNRKIKEKAVVDINAWGLEPVTTGRFTLSRAHRVALHRHSLNPDNRTALTNKHGGFGLKLSDDPNKVYKITEDELDEIVASLDKNELAFSEAYGNLSDSVGDAMSEVFLNEYGYSMPRVDSHFRKDVMPFERGSDVDFETEEMLKKFSGQWARPGLDKSFLEARVGSTKPIYLNPVFDEINKTIDRASMFIGLESPLNNASKLIYNKKFRKALVNKFGSDNIIWQEIDKGLKDIAGIHEMPSSLERLALAFKDRFVTNVFGLNPFIVGIQSFSYPMYLRYVPQEHLLQGSINFWQDPKASVEKFKRLSPVFRKRIEGGFNKDLQELSQRSSNVELGGSKELAQKLTGGISGVDMVTVGQGMESALDFILTNIEKGVVTDDMRVILDLTESDLPLLTTAEKVKLGVLYGEFSTSTTQPEFQPQFRSPISRGRNVLEVGSSVFSSFPLRVQAMIKREWRAYQRAETQQGKSEALSRFAQIMVLGFIVQTIGMVGRDSIRDWLFNRSTKNKSIPLRILKAWSGYWLLIRDIMGSAVSMSERGMLGYDVDYITDEALQIPANIARDMFDAFNGETARKRTDAWIRLMDDMVGGALLYKGLPYQNVKNIVKIVTPEKKRKGIGGPPK